MMAGGGRKDFATELLTKMRHNINEEEAKEMESDGGIDLNELETVFAKGGLKPSTKIIEKPAGVSAVTRSSVDAPNREQRYLIVFILYDH